MDDAVETNNKKIEEMSNLSSAGDVLHRVTGTHHVHCSDCLREPVQ